MHLFLSFWNHSLLVFLNHKVQIIYILPWKCEGNPTILKYVPIDIIHSTEEEHYIDPNEKVVHIDEHVTIISVHDIGEIYTYQVLVDAYKNLNPPFKWGRTKCYM